MMKHVKTMRWLGLGGALLVPGLAVAALNIPNTFAGGGVVSASAMNANFAAIKTKFDELETRLTQHETTEAWIPATLLSGWTNLPTATTAAYRKDAHGVVHLKGVVVPPGNSTIPFTLPPGYRPAVSRVVGVLGWTGSAHLVALNIRSGGDVQRDASGSADQWLSLDGISFHAGQ